MMSLRTCLLLFLAACGPRPPQTETTDGDTSTADTGSTSSPTTADPTTGAPSSTGADTSGGGFMLPPDEGVGFIMPKDGGGCSGCGFGLRCKQCDPWVQDCPRGDKCIACDGTGDDEWDHHGCIPLPVDPDHAGEPCTVEGSVASGVDSCDRDTMCWFIDPNTLTGVCVPRCTGSPDNPVCADGTRCLISNDGTLNLCLPSCDPLGADCGPGRLCVPSETWKPVDFVCTTDDSGAGGQLFDACDAPDTCNPGLLCTDPELATECDATADGCCLPYCDLTAAPACPGALQECLPFFPEDPPPGHEDLGVCGIPG